MNLNSVNFKSIFKPKGIKGKITLYFATLSLAMVVASIGILIGINFSIFDSYFSETMIQRIESREYAVRQELNEVRHHLDYVADKAEALREGIANSDTEAIDSCLDAYSDVFGLHSYALTDMQGYIISTSVEGYDDDDASRLASLAHYVGSHGSSDGLALILEKDAAYYSARTVHDEMGSDIGILVFVKSSLADSAYIADQSRTVDMMMTTFRDSIRINTTLVDDEGRSMSGTALDNPEALHCIRQGKQYSEPVKINGHRYFSCYKPLTDFAGRNVGALWFGIDAGIRSHLNRVITRILFWGLVAISVVLTLIYTYFINREIISPIIRLSEFASEIAAGNLTVRPDTEQYKYETGILQNSLTEMAESMKKVIGPIVEMAQQLHAASEELSKASLSLSDGASQQAASLEEVASSMEEIGDNIQHNTHNSMKTNQLSGEIGTAINSISTASNNSLEAVHGISEDIVSINELVMQTNILSLNASVEAARAGTFGQGFGVVAKEVGRLAEQTKQAAQTITETAQNSIAETENSSHLLNEVLPKIESVIALVKEITAASIEQNSGVTQVNTAITDLNNVTQQMATSAEEISANSEELARTAADLSKMVTFFKL